MRTIHYRGPLSSCNFACPYCPFAKAWEPPEVLEADRAGLSRFVEWAEVQDDLGVLFTPWGEALVRSWYRDAMVRLSRAPGVRRVAAQTNLSMKLDWLEEADLDTVALWATWHPGEVGMDRFLRQCERLRALGVRHSVGVVGLLEHLDAIEALRAALPRSTYVWVNAYKREADYYADADRARIRAVDPRFDDNRVYPSLDRACRGGESHFSVDGEGTVRRCHFIGAPLGNLYVDGLDALSAPRPCTNDVCRCHIGYVHMPELGLLDVYGDGLLERIPAGWA
ncbi:MAG: radical SAM protein [Alphaproteobacteria bacterium]|nr:radical SAM protein [Alphaproteobacteria bacterium]